MEEWLKQKGFVEVVGWWSLMPPRGFYTYLEEDGSWTIVGFDLQVMASSLPEDQAKESIERLLSL